MAADLLAAAGILTALGESVSGVRAHLAKLRRGRLVLRVKPFVIATDRRARHCFGTVKDNQPHTISFKVVDPARDAHRILAALRAYWERTGYLPRLERRSGAFWLRAPADVFAEWRTAFGLPEQ